ncbi:carboxypeptidase-like regulatory domain-containing protein [Flavobacterium sp. WW92]|uniref:carboxypeptidase-like regulatory domain-containing protein n=1 Tax=unclassified Flavobacterium TaxID=196869 RepID=UPI0022242D9D|nr:MULTISPECIES: carboxypeptidase-like regulatory domain-containing protein [unclassified Flavobacterium]WDO11965.1 carboxypeptidase-like regulatory domain-containing protein [Flavobacterium sp. WW92]
MFNKINISIPKPCHENWQEMTAVEKGRFCNSCQKTVYDFTKLSDRQLIQKINSEPNSCGRFLKTQLNKDLQLPKEKSSIWIAGVTGILSFLSVGNQQLFSQEKVKTEQTPEKSNAEKSTDDTLSVSEIQINGMVLDQDIPLPGVSVMIKGKSIGTQTDLDGSFSMTANKGDELEFSFMGMKNKSMIVNSNKKISIIMKPDYMLLGEVVVVRKTFFGRIFHSIGNIFR